MYQEIDLSEYLGRAPTPSEKEQFANAVIERINDRTLEFKQFGGGRFKYYTQDYADSKGVDRSNVDLFLEGDMLDDLDRDTSREKENTVAIAMNNGDEIKKGFNHHTGDTLPKRSWFGVTENEVKQITRQIKRDSQPQPQRPRGTTLAELRRELEKLGLIQTE